jgi:hypothetical protein
VAGLTNTSTKDWVPVRHRRYYPSAPAASRIASAYPLAGTGGHLPAAMIPRCRGFEEM